jgi:hypothetical protein
LIISFVLKVDTGNGTWGDLGLKLRRKNEAHSQPVADDLRLDLHLDRRGSGDAFFPRVSLDLLEVRAKFDWDCGCDSLRNVMSIVDSRNKWSRVEGNEMNR